MGVNEDGAEVVEVTDQVRSPALFAKRTQSVLRAWVNRDLDAYYYELEAAEREAALLRTMAPHFPNGIARRQMVFASQDSPMTKGRDKLPT